MRAFMANGGSRLRNMLGAADGVRSKKRGFKKPGSGRSSSASEKRNGWHYKGYRVS